MPDDFLIRDFLSSRGALLVHFSTIMARRQDLVFPADLRNAITLRGAPLSFSTIEVGDTNPHAGKGGAEGSVGMLVDLGPNSTVVSVSPGDSGSIYDEKTGDGGSLGLPPTPENCAKSLDKRAPSNEWNVKDYVPIGIFILPPIVVRQVVDVAGDAVPCEVELGRDQVIALFPDQPIFTTDDKTFLKFDRATNRWKPVRYHDIIPPVFTPKG
jgi:hypothetical protein